MKYLYNITGFSLIISIFSFCSFSTGVAPLPQMPSGQHERNKILISELEMNHFGYSIAKCRSQTSYSVANVFCFFLVCYTKVFRTSYWSHIPVANLATTALCSVANGETKQPWPYGYWLVPVQQFLKQHMNSTILVIPLHSLYWSIHTKDESKRGTAFAFIFGVN